MGRLERGAFLAIGAATALLLLQGIALGKPGYEVQRPSLNMEMSLPGSHGYRIAIRAFGHGIILLNASKGGVSADYAVAGRASRDGIDADFGDLGHVSVRFHGSPRRQNGLLPPSKCNTGRAPIHEVGSFDGTIRFRGEEGFTSVSATKARGTVERSFRRVCEQPAWLPPKAEGKDSPPQSDEAPMAILIAASKDDGRAAYLASVGAEDPASNGSPSAPFVIAGLEERRGKVSINRQAFVQADDGSVLVSGPGVEPVSATVALPRPFAGTASLSETAGAPISWAGSLTVSLPGAAKTPLTGADFRATLCHVKTLGELKPCLKGVASMLGPIGFFAFSL